MRRCLFVLLNFNFFLYNPNYIRKIKFNCLEYIVLRMNNPSYKVNTIY